MPFLILVSLRLLIDLRTRHPAVNWPMLMAECRELHNIGALVIMPIVELQEHYDVLRVSRCPGTPEAVLQHAILSDKRLGDVWQELLAAHGTLHAIYSAHPLTRLSMEAQARLSSCPFTAPRPMSGCTEHWHAPQNQVRDPRLHAHGPPADISALASHFSSTTPSFLGFA